LRKKLKEKVSTHISFIPEKFHNNTVELHRNNGMISTTKLDDMKGQHATPESQHKTNTQNTTHASNVWLLFHRTKTTIQQT
jgi:hypothetical protein